MSPSKCPVCGGRQTIDPGFYRDAIDGDNTTCRSCDGKGVVWGPGQVVGGVWTPASDLSTVSAPAGGYFVGVDWGMGQSRAAWSVGWQTADGGLIVTDSGVTSDTDFVVRIPAHPPTEGNS